MPHHAQQRYGFDPAVGDKVEHAAEYCGAFVVARYGAVERVSIVTDRDTGRAKGFGFVEMSATSDADRAIAELYPDSLASSLMNGTPRLPAGSPRYRQLIAQHPDPVT